MAAREPWDAAAGRWVAYVEGPNPRPPHSRRRVYLRSIAPWHSQTTTAADALRFDTKREAVAAIRGLRSRRRRGVVTGAERVE